MEWNEYFLGIAEQVKEQSKDRVTQIGCVISDTDNNVLAVGYNSFPRGCNDNVEERHQRPEKYLWIEHAERNAIYSAAMNGIALKGSTMYVSCGAPCIDCARAIINSGIKKVYCKKVCTTHNKEMWDESQRKSLIMLQECGVEVIYYGSISSESVCP